MISTADRERKIRAAFDAGDMQRAATETIALYGREMIKYLAKNFVSRSDAEEIFSEFTVRLWSTLPSFHWDCSMRTWCYRLVQSAFVHYVKAAHRQPRRNLPLSFPGVVSELGEELRHSTAPWLQTYYKDRFRELRERFDEKDQQLLILCSDQGLTFDQIAFILLDEDEPDPLALKKESQRLRRAYSRLKVRFRAIAEEEGLLEPLPPAAPRTRINNSNPC